MKNKNIEINSDNFPGLSNKKHKDATTEFINSLSMFGRHYDAGDNNRLTNDWKTTYGTPTSNYKQSWKDIISRSVDSFDNNPNTQNIEVELLNNVIGTGMYPVSRIRDKQGNMIEGLNRVFDEGWKRYNDEWDASENNDQAQSQRIRYGDYLRTGSSLTNRVIIPGNSFLSLKNQMISVLRLDTVHDTIQPDFSDPNIKSTVFGINLNKYGAAVSYWIQGAEKPILKEDLTLSFIQKVSEQYIGVPPLVAALKYLWMNEQLTTDKLVASRVQAMINLFVPQNTMNNAVQKNMNSDSQLEMGHGQIWQGKVNEEPKIIQSDDSIKDVLIPLQKLISHAITMTQGISYQSVTRDLEKVNMASGRINANGDRKSYRSQQRNIIKSTFSKDWIYYVKQMFLEGKVPGRSIVDYNRDPWHYHQHAWIPNGFDLIDPAREALAAIELNNNNMLTLQDWYGGQGKDYRVELTQLAKEKNLLLENGLTLEDVIKSDKKDGLAKIVASDNIISEIEDATY